MNRECIKKIWERLAVAEEVKRLRICEPELIWTCEECPYCKGWHIIREYPPGYVGEEEKKAIAMWKERHGLTNVD